VSHAQITLKLHYLLFSEERAEVRFAPSKCARPDLLTNIVVAWPLETGCVAYRSAVKKQRSEQRRKKIAVMA
jgi:hypothetical protein